MISKYLIVLTIVVIIQSCHDHRSGQKANSTHSTDSTSTEQQDKQNLTESPTILDTSELHKIGFSFQKIKSEIDNEEWLLKLTDTIPKGDQILGVTYLIRTTVYDDHILAQLDSLFVKLKNGVQAFGFNEWGPYMHSLESLSKPDVLFEDYNFDGIIDISVQSGGSGTNEVRYYYIFNSKNNRYNNSINMANASFDKSKKIVYQSWHMSAAEGGQSTHRFTKADTLVMTRSRNKYYVDSLDSYIIEVKTLQSNGGYSITSDTVKRK